MSISDRATERAPERPFRPLVTWHHGRCGVTGIEAAFFGALTKDADHRTSKNGKLFTLLNVVVGDGDGRQFVSVVVFGDAAVEVAELERGRRVYVEGKIEINDWTGADGNKRSGLKVISFHAAEVSKIGRRRDARRPAVKCETTSGETADANDFNDEIGF
jgi:single-stranded DNA-binding protein